MSDDTFKPPGSGLPRHLRVRQRGGPVPAKQTTVSEFTMDVPDLEALRPLVVDFAAALQRGVS